MHDSSPGSVHFTILIEYITEATRLARLHSATKLKKHELQFDFSKQVFYSFSADFWHEVYVAVKSELGLIYNNFMYMEVSIDVNKNLVGAICLLL